MSRKLYYRDMLLIQLSVDIYERNIVLTRLSVNVY